MSNIGNELHSTLLKELKYSQLQCAWFEIVVLLLRVIIVNEFGHE